MKGLQALGIILTVLAISLTAGFVLAQPSFLVAGAHSGKTVTVPSHAVELAPGLFDLGTAVVDGKVVEGLMFVHYKKENANRRENAKPPWAGGGKGDKGGSKCYEFLAKGANGKLLSHGLLIQQTVKD